MPPTLKPSRCCLLLLLLLLEVLCGHIAAIAVAEQPVARDKPAADIRFGRPVPPTKAAGTIRLAAYNVENFFDGVDDPALQGDYDDLPMQTSPDRCAALAQAIRALDADVLGLEEVESEEALRWFRDTYLKGMGYDFLASKDVGYYRGIEQSLLSRFPIRTVQVWTSEDLLPMEKYIPTDLAQRQEEGWGEKPAHKEKLTFQRSPLKATIVLPDGRSLTVYVVHHKAGGKATAHHRDLESLRVNEMVRADLALQADAWLAVIGDFNATPNQKPAKLYRDKAFAGLVSAYVFRPEADKPSGPLPADKAAATAARRLYITHLTYRSIDFILMSPALTRRAVPRSYFVLGTPMPESGYDATKDSPPPGYASDHCPIAVDLNLNGD